MWLDFRLLGWKATTSYERSCCRSDGARGSAEPSSVSKRRDLRPAACYPDEPCRCCSGLGRNPDINGSDERARLGLSDIDPLGGNAFTGFQREVSAGIGASAKQECLDRSAGCGIHDGCFDAHGLAGSVRAPTVSTRRPSYPLFSKQYRLPSARLTGVVVPPEQAWRSSRDNWDALHVASRFHIDGNGGGRVPDSGALSPRRTGGARIR